MKWFKKKKPDIVHPVDDDVPEWINMAKNDCWEETGMKPNVLELHPCTFWRLCYVMKKRHNVDVSGLKSWSGMRIKFVARENPEIFALEYNPNE